MAKQRARPVNWDDMPLIIDVAYAAWVLAVSRQTVSSLIRSGKLKAAKVGSMWRIQREDLRGFLNAGGTE